MTASNFQITLFDWYKNVTSTFYNWQGGPHNQWPPFGGKQALGSTFGCDSTSNIEEFEKGKTQLIKIIEILDGYCEWIDRLHGLGNNTINEMPITMLWQKELSICAMINE
eukprot:7188866-Ditylum_brightwellii.AAC.1